MHNITALIIIFLALTTLSLIAIQPTKANGKTIVVHEDFSTISAAIGNASQGDIILVKKGTYHENIVIDKSLSIIGEDKATTIIDGGGKGTVIQINANNIVLNGFTIQNSGKNFTDSGIYLNYSSHTSIFNNIVINNNVGMYIFESSKSLLRNNTIAGNKYNFGVYGSNLQGYIQDVDASNSVDGKPLIYWINQTQKQTPTNAGYIAVVNSTNITVEGSTLEKNWQNTLFAYTSNSTITNITSTLGMDSIWLLESSNCSVHDNNVYGNIWGGIALVNSSYCLVESNTLSGNGGYGVFLSYSSDNRFYHNNFIDNARQAWLYGENSNSWDDGYPSGGNYWGNYTGVDKETGAQQNEPGSDGIGDTSYAIDLYNVDHYPLMKTWGPQPSEVIPVELYLLTGIVTTVFGLGLVIYFAKARAKKQASPVDYHPNHDKKEEKNDSEK